MFDWLLDRLCGCRGHDYGSWTDTGETRVRVAQRRRGRIVYVQKQQKRTCQHDGCDASETRTQSGGRLPVDAFEEFAGMHESKRDAVLDLYRALDRRTPQFHIPVDRAVADLLVECAVVSDTKDALVVTDPTQVREIRRLVSEEYDGHCIDEDAVCGDER